MPDGPIPLLPPLEAIRFFRRKGFAFGFAWQDVWQDAHKLAFTVAKAMSRDVLETIREAVDKAIVEGRTLEEFRRDLRPELERLGWWGRKPMIDPQTGLRETVQLGSPRRLKTIYQVNMRNAYQAGRWERIERQKAAFPYLRYTSVLDGRERPEHHAWHGTVLPVGDAWWDTHYPPCGWGCRCTVQAFSAKMLDRRGYAVTDTPRVFASRPWVNKRTGEVHQVEQGIDPGWSYHVGKAPTAGVAPSPMPDRFDGEDIAASDAARVLAAFFSVFDIAASDAERGRIVDDRGGWPVPVSLALFQREGRLALPAPRRRAWIGRAARALAAPDEIRWVWVRGDDGRAMLFRRYVSLDADGRIDAVVDIGGAGWRWRVREEMATIDTLRRGLVAWSADRDAATSLDRT
ncbi:MAG: phage minor head protein [Pseudomonadota bacterium]